MEIGFDDVISSVREKEAQLDAAAQDLYQSAARSFRPRYPFVVVRVLPRQQVTAGGIVLPGHQQNKTVHEGIVLAVYRPFQRMRSTSFTTSQGAARQVSLPERVESQLQVGNHVLFQYWAGLPIVGYNEDRYRIVRDVADKNEGGVLGVIEYDEKDSAPTNAVAEMLKTLDGESHAFTAQTLEQRFLLVDRERNSVTLSGS